MIEQLLVSEILCRFATKINLSRAFVYPLLIVFCKVVGRQNLAERLSCLHNTMGNIRDVFLISCSFCRC